MDAVLIARDFEANLIPLVARHGVRNPDILLVRLIQYVGRTSPLRGEVICGRNDLHRMALSNALGSVRASTGTVFWDALMEERILVDGPGTLPKWVVKLLDGSDLRSSTHSGTDTGTRTELVSVRVPNAHARALSGSGSGSGTAEGGTPQTPRSAGGRRRSASPAEPEPDLPPEGACRAWADRMLRAKVESDAVKSHAQFIVRAAPGGSSANWSRELAKCERLGPDTLRRVRNAHRRANRNGRAT